MEEGPPHDLEAGAPKPTAQSAVKASGIEWYGATGDSATADGAPAGPLLPHEDAELPLAASISSSDRGTLRETINRSITTLRSFEHAADTFVRSLSSGSASGQQTFYCKACTDAHPVSDRFVLTMCGKLDHSLCRRCMSQHFATRVDSYLVHPGPLVCPSDGESRCDAVVTEEELEQLLSPQQLARYKRFKRLKENPELRECPQCHRLCSPATGPDGRQENEMKCEGCSCEFCFLHSNIHPPGADACKTYSALEQTQDTQLDADLAAHGSTAAVPLTRRCPECGILTQKEDGCNHMTCPTCHASWCWLCKQRLGNIGWHYSPGNPSGCDQFREDNGRGRDKLMVFVQILSLPVVLICVLLGVLACLLFAVVFPVICMGAIVFRNTATMWLLIGAAILVSIGPPLLLLIVIWVLWAVLSCFICLLCMPCGVTRDHLTFMLLVPLMTGLTTMECIANCLGHQ